MVIADIERVLGWDLDPEIEIEYCDKRVLVADSIRKVDDVARRSEAEDREGSLVGFVTVFRAVDAAVFAGQNISGEQAVGASTTSSRRRSTTRRGTSRPTG